MKQNFTCESDSPLIEFVGAWNAQFGDGASTNASSAVRMVSKTHGDVASFNFTGTAVWIYPASNTPRGSYDVYLDGTVSRFNASAGPIDVNTPLFAGSNLLSIPHVLSIHNTGTGGASSYLDLSVITWEERDRYGNASDVNVQGDEDGSSSFSWYPFDMWMEQTQLVPQDPHAGPDSSTVSLTVHTANASNAYMQYNFSANTVSIYGNVGPTYGPYSVLLQYDLNNGTTTTDYDDLFDLPEETFFNASFPLNRTKVLLFHAANINGSRQTILQLSNRPAKQGDSIAIDYSVVSRYVTNTSPGVRSSFSVPAMVGSIVGALLMLGLVVVTVYVLRRRRRGQLIRQQKTNIFRDLLTKRGILAAPSRNDMKKDGSDDLNDMVHGHGTTKQ